MRIVSRRRVMVAMAMIGTLALAGCAPPPSQPPPSATVTDAPIFASDAEALAAATDAYAAHLAGVDNVLAELSSCATGIKDLI